MEIQCEFINSRFGSLHETYYVDYVCDVTKAEITKPGTEITEVVGKHCNRKSNNCVQHIFFNNVVVEHFPRGLSEIFPNLRVLGISYCGLKEISRGDLRGLENLDKLCLNNNKLCTLPLDLFVRMNKLRVISLKDNELNFDLLSSKVLLPLVGNELEIVDFSREGRNLLLYRGTKLSYKMENICTDFKDCFKTIKQLMNAIDKKSVNTTELELTDLDEKPVNDNSEKSVNQTFGEKLCKRLIDLWSSGRYSDFIIIGGKDEAWKKFHVHKCVLGSQSSVLDAIFKDDLTGKQTGKMEIEDFSADTVEGMLKFIYTGEVEEKIAMDLYVIAAKYNVTELKEVSEKIVLENIDESNSLDVLNFANQHNFDKMKRKSFGIIKKMIPELSLPDEMMDKPENLKQIVEARRKRQQEIEETEKNYQAKIQKLI
jgi:Leucine-rich repeat (LRR) protein